MKLPSKFKADDHADMGFAVIPAGNYLAEAVKSEMKDTKSGTGKYLEIQFKLLDAGKNTGHIVFVRLNIVNQNEQAVEIANRELATVCRALNLPICKDSEELHGKPLTLKVGIEPAKDDFPETNRVNGYAPAKGGAKKDKKDKKGKKKKGDAF